MCVHKRINQIGRAMLMVTAGLMAAGLIASSLASSLHAQTYTISQNGKTVGSATLSVNAAADGLRITSSTKIAMTDLNYSFSATQSLDSAYRLRNIQLNGLVNGTAATVSAAQQGQNIQVKMSGNGKGSDTPLAMHPYAVFWPDFDPGALQIMVNLGAAHNNRDLWAIIPKQTGSIVPLKIVTNADEQGTVNGQPVTVHHLTVSFDTGGAEVFSGPANELLQADWTDEGFALVRQGFKLSPSARPRNTPPPPPAIPKAEPGRHLPITSPAGQPYPGASTPNQPQN